MQQAVLGYFQQLNELIFEAFLLEKQIMVYIEFITVFSFSLDILLQFLPKNLGIDPHVEF